MTCEFLHDYYRVYGILMSQGELPPVSDACAQAELWISQGIEPDKAYKLAEQLPLIKRSEGFSELGPEYFRGQAARHAAQFPIED